MLLFEALNQILSKRARDACELISRRGYHRGRDLNAMLEGFLSRT